MSDVIDEATKGDKNAQTLIESYLKKGKIKKIHIDGDVVGGHNDFTGDDNKGIDITANQVDITGDVIGRHKRRG